MEPCLKRAMEDLIGQSKQKGQVIIYIPFISPMPIRVTRWANMETFLKRAMGGALLLLKKSEPHLRIKTSLFNYFLIRANNLSQLIQMFPKAVFINYRSLT